MGLNKQIQFVRQPKPTDGEIIAQVAVFDGEGNPVDVGGAPTADTLAGATNTGKAVLKATDAAGARKAIGGNVQLQWKLQRPVEQADDSARLHAARRHG